MTRATQTPRGLPPNWRQPLLSESQGRGSRFSNHRDLDAVDGRERIEKAAPIFAAVAADPELSGRGPEVERGRLELVDGHRVALDREEALLHGPARRDD